MPFLQMENINSFLSAIEDAMGIAKIDSFMTVGEDIILLLLIINNVKPPISTTDLFEAKNLVPVVDCILAIKKKFP